MKNYPKLEKTLVLVKPDGVFRGLIGEIIARFERRGLKIIALKMIWPTRQHVYRHYPEDLAWFANLGARTSQFFKEHRVDIRSHFGTENHLKIGQKVKVWLGNYLVQGPVVAMVVQGMHAITVVRKLTGHTYPVEAVPGTIRGDFSIDSPTVANVEGRVVKNILHASSNPQEAKHEIGHWFTSKEMRDYKRSDEDAMF